MAFPLPAPIVHDPLCQENWEAVSRGLGSSFTDKWHYVGTAGEPAFQAGWANLSGANQPVAFRKFPDGTVRLRGIATGPAGTSSCFFLPVGYQPSTAPAITPDTVRFVIVAGNGPAYVQVYSVGMGAAGAVERVIIAGYGGASTYHDFSGISFSTV